MKKIKGLVVLLTVSIILFSCSCGESGGNDLIESTTANASASGYEQITQDEAKRLMDTEKDYVIIDARTVEEYEQGHIEGALLIPEYEIGERAEKELPDKNQLVLVYCRSGRRSKIASQALADLGYTNVKEFGGIIDWKYEIVK